MSAGLSLAAFAEGFANSRRDQKDHETRASDAARQDRMLDIMERQANHPLPALGARQEGLPPASGSRPDLSYGKAVASIPRGDRADYIRSGLMKRGMLPYIADAFMLNFNDESGLDPGVNEKAPIVPGSRGGFGLYQATGPRRVSLENMARERGVDPSDMDLQMDHLMFELNGPEKSAAQAIYKTKSTGAAAQAIASRFLRPAPEHLKSRVARYGAYDVTNSLGAQRP